MMEIEAWKQEADDGSTTEFTKRTTTKISIKYESENEAKYNSDIVPTVPADELAAVIKQENFSNSVTANNANSELIGATASADSFNPKYSKTVTFETLPKIETEGDDSSNEEDYTPSFETYSDVDSNSEPEIDPFADVDCDPSFSQKPDQNDTKVNNHTDLPSSSAKLILPTTTTANASNYKRKPKKRGDKLKCQLCQETQSSESFLRTHIEICAASHKRRCRFCPICNTLFAYAQAYRKHALRIHGIDQVQTVRYPLKCEFCPKAFSRIESLNAHKTLCHEETDSTKQESGLKQKPFKCLDCPSSFADLNGLTTHGKSHKIDRPFKCSELNCGKAFKFSGNLKEHLKSIHSEEKFIKCQKPNCEKLFKTNVQLAKHMLTHSETRPFECLLYPGCSKAFKSKDELTKHLKGHKGARRYAHIAITERPFKCSECDRAYCKKWQLTSHLKAHSTEIFECPEPNCGVKSRYRHNLETHISNMHTNKDELPYQCQEPNCGKKFKHKHSLNVHSRQHTGIRPFKCTEPRCNDSFKRREHLNDHVNYKHKNRIQ